MWKPEHRAAAGQLNGGARSQKIGGVEQVRSAPCGVENSLSEGRTQCLGNQQPCRRRLANTCPSRPSLPWPKRQSLDYVVAYTGNVHPTSSDVLIFSNDPFSTV